MQVPEPEQIPFYIKATAPSGWNEVFDNNSFLSTDILYKFYQGDMPKGRWYVKINGISYYLSPNEIFTQPYGEIIRYSLEQNSEYLFDLNINKNNGQVTISCSLPEAEDFTQEMTAEVIKWVDE